MTIEAEVAEIRAGLAHPFHRVREDAVKRAAALLQRGEATEELAPLLRQVAADTNQLGLTRSAAQNALSAWEQQQWAKRPGAPAVLAGRFPVRCPALGCGHETWFDKNRVCGSSGEFKREIFTRDGRQLCRLSLTCERCGRAFTHDVDCEGYT